MKMRIVADSSANLLEMKDVEFASVPVHIIVGEQDYADTAEIDLAAFQQHLRDYKGKTTTAAPSPGEWEEAFGDADVIFCFSLASVDNFAKNGRVSHVIAKGIGLMGIRIVGPASPEGTLDFKGKCRGDKKALALILEKMKELGYKGGRVVIAHNQNEEAALQLKMRIEERFGFFNGVIHPERALCCYYAEPGSVMVGFEA